MASFFHSTQRHHGQSYTQSHAFDPSASTSRSYSPANASYSHEQESAVQQELDNTYHELDCTAGRAPEQREMAAYGVGYDAGAGWREPSVGGEAGPSNSHPSYDVPPPHRLYGHAASRPSPASIPFPPVLRPTPRRALPPQVNPVPVPVPASAPAPFKPLVPRAAPSGVASALHPRHNFPLARAPSNGIKSMPFPIPLNGNTNRRRDEHLRPGATEFSAFQPGRGGDYDSGPRGAQGVRYFPTGATEQTVNKGKAWAKKEEDGDGDGDVRMPAAKDEYDDDEALFGPPDEEFDRALFGEETFDLPVPRSALIQVSRACAPESADLGPVARGSQLRPPQVQNHQQHHGREMSEKPQVGGPQGIRLRPVSSLRKSTPREHALMKSQPLFTRIRQLIAIAPSGSLEFSTLFSPPVSTRPLLLRISSLPVAYPPPPFTRIYGTDENLVVSAPTGSGKTALFELAILRLFTNSSDAKVVYLCPTKSLCSERARDWKQKFTSLGWSVVELTGDSNVNAQKDLVTARVVVTTPEKWDIITRRWNSNRKVLDKLRLLLIDECHFVGLDTRGAVLEVVVSRMRTMGSDMRILALSATAPNIEDVAQWLRPADLSDDHFSQAATIFKFGEEFRPCQLQKLVCGYPKNANDWLFNTSLDKMLYDLIKNYASRKPVLIFINTRKGCVQAAEILAKEYRQNAGSGSKNLPWPKPNRSNVKPVDKALQTLAEVGVAYHHAGLDYQDRRYVEQGFINGSISVVCATSTLAVGVNLPARMVIIKGTKQYQDGAFVDYSDSDILQMLGRAGRPQFDTHGVACIMTESDHKARFEALVKSETMLESWSAVHPPFVPTPRLTRPVTSSLHKTLTEHINSEITLRTITDIASAERWLRGTFLYTRIMKNPTHYSLIGNGTIAPDARLEEICLKSLSELVKEGIVDQSENGLTPTEYGEVMSRYYLSLETFQLLRKIPLKASMRTLLETLSACAEFSSIRFRAGEKTAFAAQNKTLKYPVAKIATAADKIMILIQLVLQCTALQEVKTDQGNPANDGNLIFQHAPRIAKAMVDLALERRDAGVKTALELLRCLNARAWDSSSYALRQLDGIGIVGLKSLAASGINTLQDVAESEPSRIEIILNRNPPFGKKVIAQAKSFPSFFINIASASETPGETGVTIALEFEVGLVATDPPPTLKGRLKYYASVCVTSSDGEYIEFRRMTARALLAGSKTFALTVALVKPSQRIFASVSCDDIGDSLKLKRELSLTLSWQGGSEVRTVYKPTTAAKLYPVPALGAPGHTTDDMDWESAQPTPPKPKLKIKAAETPPTPPKPKLTSTKRVIAAGIEAPAPQRTQLANGNYACFHKCKGSCRHLCCREGLPKPPVATRKKAPVLNSDSDSDSDKPIASSSKSKTQAKVPSSVPAAPTVQRKTTQKAEPQKPAAKPARTSQTFVTAGSSSGDEFPPIDELFARSGSPPTRSTSASRSRTNSAQAPQSFRRRAPVAVEVLEDDSKPEDDDEEVDQLASPTPSPPVARVAAASSFKRRRSSTPEHPGAGKRKSDALFLSPLSSPVFLPAAGIAPHHSSQLEEPRPDHLPSGPPRISADSFLPNPEPSSRLIEPAEPVKAVEPVDDDDDEEFDRWVRESVEIVEDSDLVM